MGKISEELAKAINDRADWLYRNEYGCSYEKFDEIYRQALGEFTAKPGDPEFCWPGEGRRCRFYLGEEVLFAWPEVWKGPMRCTHPGAGPGVCPFLRHGCGGRLMPATLLVDGFWAEGLRCEKCGEEMMNAQEANEVEGGV